MDDEVISQRTIFRDVVKVISADDDCPRHLGRDNLAGQDTATN